MAVDIRTLQTQDVPVGTKVLPRKGSIEAKKGVVGHTTGKTKNCNMEGCKDLCLCVKWSDTKKTTSPCASGMKFQKRSLRIL